MDVRVAGTIRGALVGHPSLRKLIIDGEVTSAEARSAFGAAFAALIVADVPALQVLKCRANYVGDAGLAPIVEALALNHHLRKLDVSFNDMSEALQTNLS